MFRLHRDSAKAGLFQGKFVGTIYQIPVHVLRLARLSFWNHEVFEGFDEHSHNRAQGDSVLDQLSACAKLWNVIFKPSRLLNGDLGELSLQWRSMRNRVIANPNGESSISWMQYRPNQIAVQSKTRTVPERCYLAHFDGRKSRNFRSKLAGFVGFSTYRDTWLLEIY